MTDNAPSAEFVRNRVADILARIRNDRSPEIRVTVRVVEEEHHDTALLLRAQTEPR